MAATITVGKGQLALGLPGGSSSALNVTAAGVIKASPGILALVSCIAAGTITINDSASTGGDTTGNEIFTMAMTVGQVVPVNFPCFNGITVSAVSAGQFALSFS